MRSPSPAATSWAVPRKGSRLGPIAILWFTENAAIAIGMFNPATDAIAEFTTPTAGSGPQGITAGPDGNLWFTEAWSRSA